MSFIGAVEKGHAYEAGWFLAHEECDRKTRTISQTGATDVDGRKYVKAGTIFPSNDENAEGIVYEDVDVTTGAMPGSVVLSGVVYEDRLPVKIAEGAKTALTAKGFKFIETTPAVTRPDWAND